MNWSLTLVLNDSIRKSWCEKGTTHLYSVASLESRLRHVPSCRGRRKKEEPPLGGLWKNMRRNSPEGSGSDPNKCIAITYAEIIFYISISLLIRTFVYNNYTYKSSTGLKGGRGTGCGVDVRARRWHRVVGAQLKMGTRTGGYASC